MLRTVLLFFWLLAGLPALGAPPSMERLTPAAGQRGTEFPIRVTGSGLARVSQVLFYDDSVRCTKITALSDNELQLSLQSDAGAQPGPRAFRVQSPEGLSELLVVSLTALPTAAELEDNNSPETAQTIPLNTTVVGTIDDGDADCFRVTLGQGQRLSVEAEAIRSGGAMFDAVVNIFSPDGTWLRSVDDTFATQQDPWLSMTAAAAGDYVIQIHETSFEGGEANRYALHIGEFPRPAMVWPPGASADQQLPLEFRGEAETWHQTVMVPAVSESTTIRLFPEASGSRAPIGIPFRVSPFASLTESAQEQQERPLALPLAFNGLVSQSGESDVWRFLVVTPAKFRFEVFAARIGSPLDAILEVRTADGVLVASADDEDSHDSAISVTFAAAGEYRAVIRDKRGNGSSRHVYRIEAAPWRPTVTAFVPRPNRLSQERQTLQVPRGNRTTVFLGVRRDGFSGDVRLDASGLPVGVELGSVTVPADRFWVPLVVEADEQSPVGGGLVNLAVTGQSEAGPVAGHFRQVVDLVAASADQLFQSAEVDRLAVAVTESVPWRVDLQQPRTSLAPDGTLSLKVTVHRDAGFNGDMEITFPFLPPWVDGPQKVLIPATETEGECVLRAWPEAEPRTWPLCVEARPAAGTAEPAGVPREPGERRQRPRPLHRTAVSSQLVALTIARAPVSGTLQPIVTEQGRSVMARCRLVCGSELPERLTAVLEGLPNRVTAKSLLVNRGTADLQFEVQPEATAPIGSFDEIRVRLSGELNGEQVSWIVGRGAGLQIMPAGELQLGTDGRPLSRLEVLRKKAASQQK